MGRSGPARFPSRARLAMPVIDVEAHIPWSETLAMMERARSRAVRLEQLSDSQQHAARADIAESCALEITAAFHEQQVGRVNYALTQDDVDALVLEARWRRYLADDSRWHDDPDNRTAVPFEGDAHAPQDIKARLEARPKPPRRARGELPPDAPRFGWSWTAWVSLFLAERRRVVGLDQVSLLPVEREPGDDDDEQVGWAGEGAIAP